MALWKYNENDITKATNTNTGDTRILTNGVYEMTITSAYLQKSQKSLAEAIVLQCEANEKTARVQLWIKNSKGEPIEFSIGKLNRMCYLMQVNPEKIETRPTKMQGVNGEYERDIIPVFMNKTIGMFLEVEANGKYPQYNVIDFFDPNTKRTSNEAKEQKLAEVYNKMVERYKDSTPVVLSDDDTSYSGTVKMATPNTGDEFPF